MKVIQPTVIDDVILVSSSVVENDFPAWSAATTYAVGDKTIKVHRIWQSVQATNLNHDPETAGVSWWVDVGPTNQWAMFDSSVGTVTTDTNEITIVLEPGRIDSVCLLSVDCASVTVSMSVDGWPVYSYTESMIDSAEILEWYAYFYEPLVSKTDLVLTNIPAYGEGVLTATLSKTGTVSCGVCIVGIKKEIGNVLTSPTVGIVDFSSVTRDTFGTPTLIKRSFSKRCNVKLILDKSQVDEVYTVLAGLRATPMVWVGSENNYQCLVVYGFYKDFEIDIAYSVLSYCTLSIEGMT